MPRLTLRTLLAYIDDTLEPAQARALGRKVAESDEAKLLIERIKKVTRRRGLKTPVPDGSDDDVNDPNVVAEYLSDSLESDQLKQMESTCLDSDVHLAEVAACHQILTLLMTEPVRVPPTAHQRMYQLVPPPASDLNRKPGKTIPVGRVAPPTLEQVDDDPDAALLLGMKRYAAADSRMGRFAIVAAVVAIGLFLALAVIMALPPAATEAPLRSRGPMLASANGTATAPTPIAPVPHADGSTEPKGTTPKGPTEPKVIPEAKGGPEPKGGPDAKTEPMTTVPMPKVEGTGTGGLGEKRVPPPNAGRGAVGTMDIPNVIVLTKSPDPGSQWLRLGKESSKVDASSVVMALPGYKAEVKLDSNVVVQLWGNLLDQIPESYLMKLKVFQSRVRFHQPPAGLDADITLEEGRIYVRTTKATGAKVRIRTSSDKWSMATAAWDIDLPNDKSQVMVEAHTAFVPGTPYPKDGVGGTPPQTDLVVVVVRGTADFEDLDRAGKKYAAVPTWNQIAWNSKADKPGVQSEVNKKEIVPEADPLITAAKGEVIQKSLSDAANGLRDRDGIRTLLESRMDFEKLRGKRHGPRHRRLFVCRDPRRHGAGRGQGHGVQTLRCTGGLVA